MVSILYKWLLIFGLNVFTNNNHPLFISVTEIDHNPTAKTLEISCKIFTDDFETALRKTNTAKIDLLDVKVKPSMNALVNNYIQKHLAIKVNDKSVTLMFLGFEQEEEGIVSFYEVKNIDGVKKLDITNNILYENKPQQMGIIHVNVNGVRKSTRINNPEAKAGFVF